MSRPPEIVRCGEHPSLPHLQALSLSLSLARFIVMSMLLPMRPQQATAPPLVAHHPHPAVGPEFHAYMNQTPRASIFQACLGVRSGFIFLSFSPCLTCQHEPLYSSPQAGRSPIATWRESHQNATRQTLGWKKGAVEGIKIQCSNLPEVRKCRPRDLDKL